MFGIASATRDLEVDAVEKDNDAPPHEVVDHELRDEPEASDATGGVGGEETMKPRVGRRQIPPT